MQVIETSTIDLFVYCWIALAVLSFPFLLRVTAPYGRHTKTTWGAMIENSPGWMIMESPVLLTWCPPAFAFFLWTLVNLIPRAMDHHTWYKQQFANYPLERKAVIPYIL